MASSPAAPWNRPPPPHSRSLAFIVSVLVTGVAVAACYLTVALSAGDRPTSAAVTTECSAP